MTYDEIIKRAKLDDDNIICVYPYGSRVYGNSHKGSDYDFIVIVRVKETDQFSDNLININYYTVQEHQQRLDDHEISALECFFLIKNDYKVTMKFKFVLDIAKLRHSLSKKSSNSWVKCKKKLTIPQDYDINIGKKSMFHAFRIIQFGIQIVTSNKIADYSACNGLYDRIMTFYLWNDLYDEFKPEYNHLCTVFREITHK